MESEPRRDSGNSPALPTPSERMDVKWVVAPHPAVLDSDRLLAQCGLRTQRRSGPGGQHRNKTSSGVFLQHEPTGIVGEATERRSQADNRAVALGRLRHRLAVEVRTTSALDGAAIGDETALRDRYRGTALRIADRNDAKAGVLALVLNDLHACGGQPSAVAPIWRTSTSSIVRFVKSHPPAFAWLNAVRDHHGRRPLK